MKSRRALALGLLTLLAILLMAGCADPRPIAHLTAPTPIPLKAEPTATLLPVLVEAQEAAKAAAQAPAGEEALPVPPQRPSAEDGAMAFAQNCVVCHGEDGKGVIPDTPDFTAPDLFRERAPAELFLSVSKGKGTMPPWESSLDEQTRWNVVFYALDFAVSEEALQRGKDVYTTHCVVCHGEDGKGLLEDTPDFTSPEFVATTRLVDLFQSVTDGKGTMPPWKGQLTEEDRWAVLTFIRTMGYDSLHK
ncbi:MAG: c-type cytochrome [Chloroflexi bacterium]|nr:c-type cytochrome [Chloroflexota bacterium]